MQRFRWIALQGSSRGFLPPLLLFVFLITTSGIPAHAADDPAACRALFARIVSIQGTVEVLRAGQNAWSKVTRLDTPLCEGDRLRTGALSRAALFIQPETLVRVDQNTNISVSQTAEETLIEFRQEDVLPAAASAYSCGAGYFITRFPRKFRVKTPHLNAAVEGTEFLVAMRCESTELSVFEGKVLAAGAGANIFPAQSISSGQILTIGGSEPPTVRLLVKPTDAVQWVLYYPPLSDATAEADLPPAEQCRSLPKPLDQTCLTKRAEALLRLGRVDEAQREVDEAVALDPGSGDANALRAIISIARNDKAGAMEAATAATTASPNSSRAWLALSYAQQASFKLEDSLSSARKAQALEPNSSVTNARVAELLMSLGRIKEAEVAARAAVDANPSESRAHTVLGFVHLAQINTKEARADFEAATERDSSDPLPRLGLGLAKIREGRITEGREQIEIAVALDPTNSLLRSYIGKAYYDERTKARDQLAETQFKLAKELDSKDPTPWFYDAIRKQTENRAGEALSDLRRSIVLNDDRAVYRSRILLDQDSASRSVSLSRIYTDLGFDQLALTEGVKSVTSDPGNYSSHRFLADSYASTPRFDAARISELLQSQLLQPATASSLQPQLGEAGLLILERTGPPVVSFQEFNPLFERDRATLYLSGVVGNRGTYGDELLASAQRDGNLFSAGQFHYQTDGFRQNDDLKQDIYTAFVQKDVSYQSSLQAEFRKSRTDRGDVTQNFDPNSFSTNSRVHLDSQTGRLGARHSVDAQNILLASVILEDRNGSSNDQSVDNSLGIPLLIHTNTTGSSRVADGELQYLFRSNPFTVTAGVGYYDEGFKNTIGARVTLDDGTLLTDIVGVDDSAIRHENMYLYSNINLDPHATLVTGISADFFKDSNIITTNQANPKLGLVLRPTAETTLRFAAFRYLKRSLAASATLEPTQVAGFNQLFDDVNGTDSKAAAAGLDQGFSENLFAGVQLMARKLTVPLAPAIGIDQPASLEYWRERLYRAYASWLAARTLAIDIEFKYDRQERDFPAGASSNFLSSIDTRLAPLTLTYRDPGGFFARIRATHVSQTVEFPALSGTTAEGDRFWLADASLGYRLPRRIGIVSLNATNLFNQSFRFQDTDLNGVPRPPMFWPGRVMFVTFTVTL